MGGDPDPSPAAPDPTGSATSSGRSSDDSTPSETVWTPWPGEITVPPELVPLFIRTQIDLALQIVQGEMEQMQELLDATPKSEWLLRHTLKKQQNNLETCRLELLGILFRNQEEKPDLLIPDHELIGRDGRPLSRVPEA